MVTPETKKTPKRTVKKPARNDSVAAAIARYKARRAKRLDEAENPPAEGLTPEELVQLVREAAMGTIAQQDEDLDTLLGVIDTLMAKEAFDNEGDEKADDGEDENVDVGESKGENTDDDGEENSNVEEGEQQDEEENTDEGENDPDADSTPSAPPPLAADSRSALAEHLNVCRVGDKLHLDGLDRMSLIAAKKAVIRKVRPEIRLDGKSKAYISAAYDMAAQEVSARKSTDYQRQQMMSGGKSSRADSTEGGADAARQRMIQRNQNRNGGKK